MLRQQTFTTMDIIRRQTLLLSMREARERSHREYFAAPAKKVRKERKGNIREEILQSISEETYQNLRILGMSDKAILGQIKKGTLHEDR